jgi:phosphatidylglycerophosphatase A
MQKLVILVASAGYIGYIPVASGTFGSLVGVPLFFAFDGLRQVSASVYVLMFTVAVLAACWIAGSAEKLFDEHDSHKIVIDEVVGHLAATLFLAPTWSHAIAAFFVFRVLDVVKPFPASYIDANFSGGYGVTLDDVVSGLYSNLVLRAVIGLRILS